MAISSKQKASSKKVEKKSTLKAGAAKSKSSSKPAAKPIVKPKPVAASPKASSTTVKKADKVEPLKVVPKTTPTRSRSRRAKDTTPKVPKLSKIQIARESKTMATVKGKIPMNLENKKPVIKPTTKTDSPPTPVNGKTRYSDTELAEFKKLIDDKLVTARQELNYLQEQIVEMNENNSDVQGSDWFDDSSIHAEVELLNNMAIRQRQFIQNLENALIRIENKTYGICIITGALIDKKRLLLVPHATKSIEAKHIEQASMIPEINQVAPDERVLRRTAEGKGPKKPGAKKTKSKSTRDFEEEDGDEAVEAPLEEMDINFEVAED